MFKKLFISLAVLIFFSSIAKADTDGAVAANKWLITAPSNGITNLTSLGRTTTRVDRGRSVYFPISLINGSDESVVQQISSVPTKVVCTIGGNETTGCASAPLFIASDSATMCVDSDMSSSTDPSAGVITVYTCLDSTCNRTQAVDVKGAPILAATDDYACAEANGTGGSLNVVKAGGSWIYVVLSGALDGVSGQTLLVKVTGR